MNNYDKLDEAINNCQTEKVVELLAAANKRYKYHEKAYILALDLARWDIVKAFIEWGMPIDTLDKNGSSALIRSTTSGYPELVKFIVEHGADVNLGNRWHKTALGEAVRVNDTPIVKLLIDAGADIHVNNIAYEGGLLFEALSSLAYDPLEILLKHGVSIDNRNYYGNTIMEFAKKINNLRAIELINIVIEHKALESMIDGTDFSQDNMGF